MLQIKNLSKIYSNGASKVNALDDLNINFGSKGLVVILGRSGCGKSTLINMIGGLDYPSKGEIIINGKSSKTFSKSELDGYRNTFVGVVFQEFNLIDEISVFQNIDMTMKLQEKNADVNTVDEVLSMVGLNNLGYRKPSELSGGQRQRVALARALLKKPEIILADEPTGSLDSTTGEEVFESLKKIAQDKLVIVVTHDKELAYTYGERIVELQDGKIVGDFVRQSESSRELRELSDNVIEAASPSKLTASHLNKRLKKDEVNYIGLSYDKERIALAYSETVDSFYEKADAHRYAPTEEADIKNDEKPFALSKGKMQLAESFRMARANIKRTKKRYALLTILTSFCFTFLIIAIIASTINIPGLVAKGAFDKHAQDVISITKTQKDEWGNLYETPLESSDAERISSILGVSKYVYHSDLFFNPKFANGTSGDFQFYEDYRFIGFNGILEGSPLDVGLELVEGSKENCVDNEIIISDMAAFEILRSGYMGIDPSGNSGLVYAATFAELLGAKIKVQSGDYNKRDVRGYFKIVGIFKTDYEDYKSVMSASPIDSNAAKLFAAFVQNINFLYSKAFVSSSFLDIFMVDLNKDNVNLNYEYYSDYYTYGYSTYNEAVYSPENSLIKQHSELYWSKSGDLKLPAALNRGEIIITYETACSMIGINGMMSNELKNDSRFLELVNKALSIRMSYFSLKSREISSHKSYTIVGVLPKENDEDWWWEKKAYFNKEDMNEFLSSTDYTSIYVAKTGTRYSLEGRIGDLIDEGYYVSSAMLRSLDIVELSETVKTVAKVFLWISLGFGVFAFLIIFNYMSSSIRFRRKEIAVYRVIGAKSRDISKIFLSEGFIISIRITVIVSILAWCICWFLNLILQEIVSYFGITVTLISFSFFHPIIVFLLVSAFFVLSALIPIRAVTRKTPIEALKML